MKKVFANIYETSYGSIRICSDDDAITEVKFSGELPGDAERSTAAELTDEAARQLEEYFTGRRRVFTVPLRSHGTAFQRAVWDALLEIPFGETRSYKQVAQAVGNPSACRAVGMANNRNPISVIIPCHRVIGADGSLVGYGGGLEMKERLLRLEAGQCACDRE